MIMRHRRGAQFLQAPDRDRLAQALDHLGAQRLADEAVGERRLDRVRHQGLVRRRQTGQPGSQVHAIAGHGVFAVVVRARAAGDDLARGDADMHLERRFQRRDGLVRIERRADRPLGIVCMGDRRAEHRHDGVADVLVDGAAVARHHAVDGGEKLVEQRVGLLGVEPAGQLRVAR